jgi:oligopeptide/dipeptide ABC transporter ATP-binding protein
MSPAGPAELQRRDAAGSAPLLTVRGLAVHFPIRTGLVAQRRVGAVRAVDGISFDLYPGETLGLVGESGSGKSTTGRALVRLSQPTAGTIHLGTREVSGSDRAATAELRRRIQMIFQDPYSSLNPRMTVGAIVAEPLAIRGTKAKERIARTEELLELVGLPRSSAYRYPHQFSGGQRQRIGIARALAVNPDIVIADEPISALDVSIQAQILNLLRRLQRELGLAYLFISHDLAAVRYISQRIMVMYLGRIAEVAPSTALYRRPRHPYTVALLSAAPIPDPRIESQRRRIILSGDTPSPVNPPPGCRFSTRCWLRRQLGNPERCSREEPELTPAGNAQSVACHFADKVDGSDEQRMAVANAP